MKQRTFPDRGPRTWLFLAGITLLLSGCKSTPEYERLGGDDLYRWSREAFQREDWGDASKGFERMVFMFPAHDSIVHARLDLGWSYYHQRQYVTAAAEFSRLIDRHPTHPLVPGAALGMCESYAALSPIPQRDQSYTQQALASCANLIVDHPGSPAADSALVIRNDMVDKLAAKEYQRGRFYFRRGLYDSANVYFQQVLDLYPQSSSAPQALYSMYESYTAIGYEEDAQEVRDRLLTQYPESEPARRLRGGTGEGGSTGDGEETAGVGTGPGAGAPATLGGSSGSSL